MNHPLSKQNEYNKEEIRDLLLGMSAKEFFSYYFNRKNFEEIPLLTNDDIVIPNIGLREALSKENYVNNVPTLIGSKGTGFEIALRAKSQFLTK